MDKRKRASAIKYDQAKDAAPRVVAKGRGLIAEKIIEVAREKGIPVVENSSLVSMLEGVDLYDMIPVNLYQALAEILVFLYEVDNEYGALDKLK